MDELTSGAAGCAPAKGFVPLPAGAAGTDGTEAEGDQVVEEDGEDGPC